MVKGIIERMFTECFVQKSLLDIEIIQSLLRVKMKFKTISYVKKNAAALNVDEPFVVTQNGIPVYVIESYAAREERETSIALLKLLTLSESDKAEGHVFSKEQLLKGLS